MSRLAASLSRINAPYAGQRYRFSTESSGFLRDGIYFKSLSPSYSPGRHPGSESLSSSVLTDAPQVYALHVLFPKRNYDGTSDDEYSAEQYCGRGSPVEEQIVGYLKRDEQRRYVDSSGLGKFDWRKIQGRTIHCEEKGRQCEQENARWYDVVVERNSHYRIAYRLKYRCSNYERESFHDLEMLSRFFVWKQSISVL